MEKSGTAPPARPTPPTAFEPRARRGVTVASIDRRAHDERAVAAPRRAAQFSASASSTLKGRVFKRVPYFILAARFFSLFFLLIILLFLLAYFVTVFLLLYAFITRIRRTYIRVPILTVLLRISSSRFISFTECIGIKINVPKCVE